MRRHQDAQRWQHWQRWFERKHCAYSLGYTQGILFRRNCCLIHAEFAPQQKYLYWGERFLYRIQHRQLFAKNPRFITFLLLSDNVWLMSSWKKYQQRTELLIQALVLCILHPEYCTRTWSPSHHQDFYWLTHWRLKSIDYFIIGPGSELVWRQMAA